MINCTSCNKHMPHTSLSLFFIHIYHKCQNASLSGNGFPAMQWIHDELVIIWVNWLFLLLFISYKFVKEFLAITFVLLVFSNWNFHDVCQRFLYNQKQNFSLIRQKTKIFPIDPHYKNRPLLYKSGQFLQWGSMGKFVIFCRIQLKFRFWLYKKRLHTS